MTHEIDYDLLAIALMTNPTCRNILMSSYKAKIDIGDFNKTVKQEVRQHVIQTLADLNIGNETKKQLLTEVANATHLRRQLIHESVEDFFNANKWGDIKFEELLIAEIRKIAQNKISDRIASIQETTSKKVNAAIKAAFNGISINLNGSDFLNEPNNDWDDDN